MARTAQAPDRLADLPEICSVADILAVFPVSRATLYRMAEQGQLPSTAYVPNATKLYSFKKLFWPSREASKTLVLNWGWNPNQSSPHSQAAAEPHPPSGTLSHRRPLGRPHGSLGGSSFLLCQDGDTVARRWAMQPSAPAGGELGWV